MEERMEHAMEELRKNPDQGWKSLSDKHEVPYKTLVEKAEAEGYRKKAQGVRIRSGAKKANKEEVKDKATNDPMNGLESQRESSPSQSESEIRLDRALEDLQKNPDQGWATVARRHNVGYKRFVEKAEAAGLQKKSVQYRTEETKRNQEAKKAEVEQRIHQALEYLVKHPEISKASIARKYRLDYAMFIKRAAAEGI